MRNEPSTDVWGAIQGGTLPKGKYQNEEEVNMSLDAAKKFIEKVRGDVQFLKELDDAESAEARLSIAKAAGFEFTKDEFDSAKSELMVERDPITGCWPFKCQIWGPECGE